MKNELVRRDVGRRRAVAADLAAAVAAVPPDLVADVPGATEEVADRQVLHPDVRCLPDQDSVAAQRPLAGAAGRAEVLGGFLGAQAPSRAWCRRR